jgi:microcystin-dependent protein
MSRNGSGVYTTPNTFVAGATITAAGHNQNWADAASEITNSVAADGQTTMTGPLKASSGTVAAPSHSFGSDPDTGAYRIGSNNYGIAVGGTKIVDVASTGASVTGDIAASGVVKQAGFALIPVGLGPLSWSGTAAPSGWVLTGQTLSRTTYAALWAFAEAEIALSNTLYGVGDGSTTFTIASTGGRVLAGKEASASRLTATHFGGNSTLLGATGGLESNNVILTHTHIADAVANHQHLTVFDDTSGTTLTALNYLVRLLSTSSDFSYSLGGSAGTANVGLTSASGGHTPTIQNAGSASAHNIVQPTIITNFIIYAGV